MRAPECAFPAGTGQTSKLELTIMAKDSSKHPFGKELTPAEQYYLKQRDTLRSHGMTSTCDFRALQRKSCHSLSNDGALLYPSGGSIVKMRH